MGVTGKNIFNFKAKAASGKFPFLDRVPAVSILKVKSIHILQPFWCENLLHFQEFPSHGDYF